MYSFIEQSNDEYQRPLLESREYLLYYMAALTYIKS